MKIDGIARINLRQKDIWTNTIADSDWHFITVENSETEGLASTITRTHK